MSETYNVPELITHQFVVDVLKKNGIDNIHPMTGSFCYKEFLQTYPGIEDIAKEFCENTKTGNPSIIIFRIYLEGYIEKEYLKEFIRNDTVTDITNKFIILSKLCEREPNDEDWSQMYSSLESNISNKEYILNNIIGELRNV